MAASPESFGPSSSSPTPQRFRLLSPNAAPPQRCSRLSSPPPLPPGAHSPTLHRRPFWAPSMKHRLWGRPPHSLCLAFSCFKGRAGRMLLFMAGGDSFIIYIYILRLVRIQVDFMAVSDYLRPYGRLWVSLGHPVLIIVRPLLKESKQNPALTSSTGRAEGGLQPRLAPSQQETRCSPQLEYLLYLPLCLVAHRTQNHLPILPLTLHFEITNPSSSSLGHYAPSPLCPGPISPWTCPVDSHVSHCCFSPTPPDSDMRPHCLLSLFHPTLL